MAMSWRKAGKQNLLGAPGIDFTIKIKFRANWATISFLCSRPQLHGFLNLVNSGKGRRDWDDGDLES